MSAGVLDEEVSGTWCVDAVGDGRADATEMELGWRRCVRDGREGVLWRESVSTILGDDTRG